ncbi:MAG: enoyl-CoA hydratase-related protein [Phenylobacterium sp.]
MTDRKTLYEVADGAAWITLNNPDARNALGAELVESLQADLERAVRDPAARCIVLTGAGTAFCAGADLKAPPPVVPRPGDPPTPFVRVLQTILDAPKPVIAAVNGAAFAGGLGLVAACDIVIAADHVKFSFSEVKIGVIPAVISVLCVPKLGAHQAMRLVLTGEAIDAQAAVSAGLVHRAVPAGELRAAVLQDIEAIRRGGPIAVAESKALVRKVAGAAPADLWSWAETKSAELFGSPEAMEGKAAFREKRAPSWAQE